MVYSGDGVYKSINISPWRTYVVADWFPLLPNAVTEIFLTLCYKASLCSHSHKQVR